MGLVGSRVDGFPGVQSNEVKEEHTKIASQFLLGTECLDNNVVSSSGRGSEEEELPLQTNNQAVYSNSHVAAQKSPEAISYNP